MSIQNCHKLVNSVLRKNEYVKELINVTDLWDMNRLDCNPIFYKKLYVVDVFL